MRTNSGQVDEGDLRVQVVNACAFFFHILIPLFRNVPGEIFRGPCWQFKMSHCEIPVCFLHHYMMENF